METSEELTITPPLETIPVIEHNHTSTENNGIYTANEQSILDLVTNKRLQIVDSITKGGIPNKVGELRVLNEILGALGDDTHKAANTRMKHQANSDAQSALDIVAETLKAIGRTKLPPRTPEQIMLPIEYMPMDTVVGETEIHPETLELKDFIEAEID